MERKKKIISISRKYDLVNIKFYGTLTSVDQVVGVSNI